MFFAFVDQNAIDLADHEPMHVTVEAFMEPATKRLSADRVVHFWTALSENYTSQPAVTTKLR